MARRAGALGGLAHALQQPGANEYPFVAGIHQFVRGAPRLLHDDAAREVAGQVPQFVLQHLLRVPPALVLPEQVHADALHDDREQQRADQHPEQPERQGDGADDQALALVLLPLCSRGGVLHGEALLPVSSSVAMATAGGSAAAASSSRSSGRPVSCKAGNW